MKTLSIFLLVLGTATALFAEPNALSSKEKAAGWVLLFDGQTTEGWTGMKGTSFPSDSWTIRDGAFVTLDGGSGLDIVSVRPYSNFELEVEWKISPGGNSGIKYLVHPEWLSPHWSPDLPEQKRRSQSLSAVGPEYQIYDDAAMTRKAGWELSSTGAAYLLYAPKPDKKMNPPGEWNTARIVVRDAHVEHWLNGEKVLEYELGAREHLERVRATKFHAVPGFGFKGDGGYIVLQHHGSPAAFRSVKIHELD